MNELEMSMTLGIMPEPIKNRVHLDPMIHAQISYLQHVFQVVSTQKNAIGSVNPDMWCELVPWHSLN